MKLHSWQAQVPCWVRFATFFVLAGLAFFQFPHATAAANSKPNIIFILTDDMGYGDIGCYSGQFVPTPNIDRLAAEGARFNQFYVSAPICSASRTAFLTGMYPGRWHITSYLQTRAGNRKCEQADFLDPKAPSIARTLKQAGYVTGHFGKWHMGGGRDVTNAPPFREYGFDEHASTYESPEPDPNITATNWIWSAYDKVKRWDRSAYFVDKALEFLRRHKGQPCYVNLWPDDVHTPWVPGGANLTGRRQGDESAANFQTVLKEYDKQVGRLLEGLKGLGLEDKTIVIFSSDNGPLPSFQGKRAGGFRGSKLSLYEGGTRMPLIIRWPGHVPSGRVDDETVISALDFFPMFCNLAEATPPRDVTLDGEDLSASLLGKSVIRHNPLFWEYGRNAISFNYPGPPRDRSPNVGVRDGKWKLLINADGTGMELYDLESDRNETRNVADSHPYIARRLRQAALQWRKSLP